MMEALHAKVVSVSGSEKRSSAKSRMMLPMIECAFHRNASSIHTPNGVRESVPKTDQDPHLLLT